MKSISWIYQHAAKTHGRPMANRLKRIRLDITVVNNPNKYFGEYIGRPSILGNPFASLSREEAIEAYDAYLREKIAEKDTVIVGELERLYQIANNEPLRLICWCSPLPCHGDIIKNVINEHHDSNLW